MQPLGRCLAAGALTLSTAVAAAWRDGCMGGFRVGCDIGGTFTDFVLIETATGDIHTAKRLTTPDDPSRAMLAGLSELARAMPGSAGAALRRWLPGVAISLSSDVLPQIKEYERSSTTVINAYVKPLTVGYLGRLEKGLAREGFAAPLQIMLSNGGIGSSQTAAEFPV